MVSGCSWYTCCCATPPKWKSNGFKSGEWVGQMMGVPRLITLFWNFSIRKSFAKLVQWGGRHLASTSNLSSWPCIWVLAIPPLLEARDSKLHLPSETCQRRARWDFDRPQLLQKSWSSGRYDHWSERSHEGFPCTTHRRSFDLALCWEQRFFHPSKRRYWWNQLVVQEAMSRTSFFAPCELQSKVALWTADKTLLLSHNEVASKQ